MKVAIIGGSGFENPDILKETSEIEIETPYGNPSSSFKNGKIGEFYNIGSNKNLTNIQITKALIKIAKNFIAIGHRVKIKFIADRP